LQVTLLDRDILKDPETLVKWCAELIEKKKPDGVDNPLLNKIFNDAGIPVSRIGPNKIEDNNNVNIIIDDRASAKEATQRLINFGHKRIGFIRGVEEHGATQERFNGYCDAGMNSGLELLTMDNRPTAIFAASDDMAAGVIVAAYRTGIKVPEEMSVMGFDDSELAERIWPTLSTVRQPLESYGISAVRHLVKRAGNKSKKHQKSTTDILDYEVILRGSTGPL